MIKVEGMRGSALGSTCSPCPALWRSPRQPLAGRHYGLISPASELHANGVGWICYRCDSVGACSRLHTGSGFHRPLAPPASWRLADGRGDPGRPGTSARGPFWPSRGPSSTKKYLKFYFMTAVVGFHCTLKHSINLKVYTLFCFEKELDILVGPRAPALGQSRPRGPLRRARAGAQGTQQRQPPSRVTRCASQARRARHLPG